MYCSCDKPGLRPVRFNLILVVLVTALTLTACSPNKDVRTATNQLRIVSLSPAATSILMDLSLAENLAGIDRWSSRLATVPAGLPAFDMIHPDAERILALEPDIIFVSSMTRDATGRDPFESVSRSGVNVCYIPVSESLKAIKRDVRFIANACGVPESGDKVIRIMDNALNRISNAVPGIPENRRKRVYFEIGSGPTLYSFGTGVYLDELIRLAGGRNIFDGQSGWLAVHAEQVLALNPDVILTNVPEPDAATTIAERPGWDSLRAVRHGQVFGINHEASSQPAPTIVRALEEVARALHPEAFATESISGVNE